MCHQIDVNKSFIVGEISTPSIWWQSDKRVRGEGGGGQGWPAGRGGGQGWPAGASTKDLKIVVRTV